MVIQENALIRQAQNGDIASFDELIRSHQARLFRLVLAVAGNTEDAEDALQETLLQVYRALPTFRGESSFTTWLYRIAINRTRNWIRTQARASSERFADRMALVGSSVGPRLDDELVEKERRHAIRKALAKLPEHYRRPILLRHYLDMTYEEIADVLSIPIGTVRSRLAEGRRLLQRGLANQGYAPTGE